MTDNLNNSNPFIVDNADSETSSSSSAAGDVETSMVALHARDDIVPAGSSGEDADGVGIVGSTDDGGSDSGSSVIRGGSSAVGEAGADSAVPDAGLQGDGDDVHVGMLTRLYVKSGLFFRSLPDRYRRWASDDNPNKVDRDRMLAFALMPIFLGIITKFFVILVSYSALGIYMLWNHASFNDAVTPVQSFYNDYLGIPVALLGMAVVMFSPAVRDVLKFNGGVHAGVRSESIRKDMHVGKAWHGWLLIVGVAVFGGVFAWIIHTVILNVLYAVGIDASGVSKVTKNVLGASHNGDELAAIGFSGFTIVSIVFSVVFSPLLEEVVFRGFIARSLVMSSFLTRKDGDGKGTRSWWQMLIVLLICGIWFGAGHISTANTLDKNIFLVLFMTLFAAFMTWLSCVKFDSIWPAVGVHVVYNVITIIIAVGLLNSGATDTGTVSTLFALLA